MELVVEIDDKIYKDINDGRIGGYQLSYLIMLIRDGTSLPEHHGRLIDADRLENKLLHSFALPTNYGDRKGYRTRENECFTDIVNTPTIIEADNEVNADENG